MDKAILVMDMPERCDKCNLFLAVKQKDLGLCLAKQSSGETNTESNQKREASWRPDWCPLQKLPDKEEELPTEKYLFGGLGKAFVSGWNACLDKITSI